LSLGLTSRRLVASARSGLDPAPDVAARVRAKVAAAVTGAPVTAPAAVGVGKFVVLGAIVSAIGIWFVAPRAMQVPTINVPVSAMAEPESQLAVHVTSSVHAEAAPVAHPAPAVIAHLSEIVQPAAQSPAPPTLAREIELVDSAMVSLRGGDLAKTLSTLDVYEYETTGHGQLAEDATALEIEARCRSRMESADKLAVFDQRWPNSVQRARITSACSDR
jgi:hypothetical protein